MYNNIMYLLASMYMLDQNAVPGSAYEDAVDLWPDRSHHPDARTGAWHAEKVISVVEEGRMPGKSDEQTHPSSCST